MSTSVEHENESTRAIEDQTMHIASDTFLAAAGGSVLLALVLKVAGRNTAANFVGQWVPSILCLGIYNKLVKSERAEHGDY